MTVTVTVTVSEADAEAAAAATELTGPPSRDRRSHPRPAAGATGPRSIVPPMRMSLAGLACALLAACGGPDEFVPSPDAPAGPPGPFDELELAEELPFDDLEAPVHVARDEFGVAHIHAENLADLAFAQGYVMAHDRLPQMDILRRFGSGRLAELFGALDAGVIETDLEMRIHRMRPVAEQAWATLQASSDPTDREIVTLLQRFADGVNAYADDVKAGRWQLDPRILASFSPSTFAPWEPVDSLVLGRFQAFALSWTTPVELDITDLWQGLRATFDAATAKDPAARFQRVGIAKDVLRIAPVGKHATIDGFPNVDVDTGTRSDGPAGRAATAPPSASAARAPARQPEVPRELLRNARAFFRATMVNGPHAFMVPSAGSNNWVVADELAGGKTLIAGDQHLQLPNPSIFYPVHLIVPDKLDAEGITFPGIPGIVLGHNGKVAWSATVVYHDVNDVYLETIVPCAAGGGDCAVIDGDEVPLETWTETVQVGALGTITRSVDVTYERVPGRGPIIPTVVDGELAPRTGGSALSVQYTGHEETFEIRATYGLANASNVDDAFAALGNFSYGGQNWAIIDNQGNIGWTTHARVPLRSASAYAWHPEDAPDGAAPFFVLPGDSPIVWEGFMPSRYIPHAINPPSNYLVTANSDPVGMNFDGVPFDGPVVDGRPLWVGTNYASGLRTERIATMLEAQIAGGEPLTLDGLATIQHDASSTVGRKLRDALTAALGALDDATGQPADVAAFVAGLSEADEAALRDAGARLAAWTFETPPAVAGTPTAQEITDSTATTIFNTFMHFFIQNVLGDELAAVEFSPWDLRDDLLVRTIYALVDDPDSFVQSPVTNQPVICDDMATPLADGSCTGAILASLLDAVRHLTSADGFASADADTWRWGELHRLTLEPLFPNADLEVPARNETGVNAGGFPRAGDNLVVNRADSGWADLGFRQSADGPAQRFLAEATMNGTMKLKWALPGGAIYDPRSPHYRDLLDTYYLQNRHFDAPYSIPEIVAAGESRWVFY